MVTTYTLYNDILNEYHTLIGGQTRSGKTVILDGIIATLSITTNASMILLDPKRVSFTKWRRLKRVIAHETETDRIIAALQYAVYFMDDRYKIMMRKGIEKWNGEHLYIIVDELSDLMCTVPKQIKPLLQRLAQLGAAAGIHLIVATQAPSRKVIPAELTLNFTCKIALHCDSDIESRQIINEKGAEKLPKYGQCLYKSPNKENIICVIVPMYHPQFIDNVIKANLHPRLYSNVNLNCTSF